MKAIGGLAVLMVFAALLPAMSGTPAREITLVARGMAFYLEGELDTPNPTLELRAGERVRVVFRNEERGIAHDFAVPTLDVGIDLIRWNERGAVAFDVPETPGIYEYICRPHRLMMKGTIRVIGD